MIHMTSSTNTTVKKIYKYELNTSGYVDLPNDAEILSVQMQQGCPVLWALVDPDSPTSFIHAVRVYGTGHPCESPASKFIATAQNGSLVWHFFEAN